MFSGHGNAFHGAGGRGNKKAQMRGCLRLLRAVVSHGDEITNQDLCDQGIISQLLSEYTTYQIANLKLLQVFNWFWIFHNFMLRMTMLQMNGK